MCVFRPPRCALARPPPRVACRSTWLLPCLRLVVLLVPSARATKVGSSWILEREPRVGRFGALVDVVRLSYGECAAGWRSALCPLRQQPPTCGG